MIEETVDAATAVLRTPAGIARKLDSGAIVFRRWAATWIDFLFLGGLLFGIISPAANKTINVQLYQLGLLVWLGVVVLYYPVLEGVWGRTVGKLVTGIVVVNNKGKPPGLVKAAMRTLTRLLEVNPLLFGGIPAGLIVLNSAYRQRLGDVWADTYVIPASSLAQIGTPAG